MNNNPTKGEGLRRISFGEVELTPLNLIVCVKVVPHPDFLGALKIDPVKKTLRREEVPLTLNPLDRHALEEALRIRETHGGKITVLSMGPPKASEALKEALQLGVDRAVLLSDPAMAGADTLATARTLAAGVRAVGGFDLILCGHSSLDGGSGHVPPQLATLLEIPHATSVRKLQINSDGTFTAERQFEGGVMVVEAELPGLVALGRGINTPRYPTLIGLVEAERKTVEVWGVDRLNLDRGLVGAGGSPTRIVDLQARGGARRVEMVEGSPRDQAQTLIGKLKRWGVV